MPYTLFMVLHTTRYKSNLFFLAVMATTATDNYDSIVFGMLGGRKAYEQSIAALVSFAQLQPDESVLELCCGTGISTGELLRVNQNITAVELNKERIQRAKESLPPEVRLLTKDALELTPETDGRYDVVMCINGFYHFNEADFYALAERMLKPGGRLVFNVKLKDHGGVAPIHQTLVDTISSIIHEMRLFGRNSVQPTFIDRSYIKSAIEPETFTVPPPFIMSRHEARHSTLTTARNGVRITHIGAATFLASYNKTIREILLFPPAGHGGSQQHLKISLIQCGTTFPLNVCSLKQNFSSKHAFHHNVNISICLYVVYGTDRRLSKKEQKTY